MRFSIYQDSHVGGRPSNQDRMGYCFTRDALLLLLADGMGGHLNGEIAASLSLQTMGALFRERAAPAVNDPSALLDELVFTAHQSLLNYRATHRLPDTPRTTVVACLVQHGQAWWAHCGDSRLYWLRGGRILARTVDHSHLERLVALGRVSPYERANHPERNKLYNCVGAPTLPQVDKAKPVTLQSGDQLLLSYWRRPEEWWCRCCRESTNQHQGAIRRWTCLAPRRRRCTSSRTEAGFH